MNFGYAYDDIFLQHDTGDYHPERPERLEAIMNRLIKTSYFRNLTRISPEKLAEESILPAHDRAHQERFMAIQGKTGGFDGDTPFSPKSFEAALIAAGSGVSLAKKILSEDLDAGIALVRPPGHHAETGRAMGFCLLNNIAITAHYLLNRNIRKVYILDWDVHHGNGTQEIFYDSDKVFFASLHQYPFYPGSGSAREIGSGQGLGFTLNVPLPSHSSNSDYLKEFQEKIIPSILEFEPEFLLISAGFDAHKQDPLGGMSLSTNAFSEFTRSVKEAAFQSGSKIISFLEGGYDLQALAESVEAHVAVLAG
ncbi:histone deacetylase family protein [Leptospira inadai serovar Lyme str. 10]|uniref:Histone deacetylase family protein n=2 Tax=Leptospira inadai serovar Lyme TaxID=293084 RepID=V6HE80_9LEPT|nr:histone deacetylase [Leptospira inadai]EQA38626.1 histone deacetylase family protein [Leptospira inadai serovar Lyme str. 10]PNV71398.1 histone deacetylase [Leptospira inadai serovar Lyme]